MLKKTKLWQLYIIPFLFVILVLSGENTSLYFDKLQSFEDIAKETNALGERDIRQMEKVHVQKVIDGDTIKIDSGENVRFIGVDTPETVHPKKSVQCFGKEASDKNKELKFRT